MRRLLLLAQQKKIRVQMIPEILGEHFLGEAIVTVLAPVVFDPKISTNNNSLVLKIKFGEDTALWTGDIESKQEQMASRAWQAKILKAPHHGSKSSSSDHLVQMVSPEQVIFCTQAENNFGFPHEKIKRRWEDARAEVLDTGILGKIEVVLSGNGIFVETFWPK